MVRKRFLLFLVSSIIGLPWSAKAQTATQQLTNQVVQIGQTATFTVTVSGGPCRSQWTVAGTSFYGTVASAFSYTTPAATAAMNGESVAIDIYGCTGGNSELRSAAILTVSGAITLAVSGTVRFDDGTTVYVGAITANQWNGTGWVSAGTINSGANGNLAGSLTISAGTGYVDTNGNVTFQFGIPGIAGLTSTSQALPLAEFQQGSTGLTITWVLFKKAPLVTKAEGLALTP
jgi:hypothetical protein